MQHSRWLAFVVFLAGTLFAGPIAFAEPQLEIQPGDRVLFVGNTLIERAQRYDYLELAITTRYPDVTYRNLGWSGDTVYGEARAYFGSPADGFNHLKEHVHALEPTVLLVAYGLNESSQGEAGLEAFTEGLNRLLAMLSETGARIVLLSPLPHEQATSPVPDVSPANADIKLYSQRIAAVAEAGGHAYVDLYTLMAELQVAPPMPLTNNGIHLTEAGYYHLAGVLEAGLGWPRRQWHVHVDAGEIEQAQGTQVQNIREDGASILFDVTDDYLPLDLPDGLEATRSTHLPPRLLKLSGIEDGTYQLVIDGNVIAEAGADAWAKGVEIHAGPSFQQAAALREQILLKNKLFFHQFRPQNETYIRGFRKHEQGRHAADLPRFDPLIEEREVKINRLRRPVTHTYEIKPVN
ncbi:MAG: SGNH/GDSL hydrolase family protein [Phycisphaeraceae bacterium]